MNLRKLLVMALFLGGVYGHSHSMDKEAWQADLYQTIVDGNVERLKACIAQDTTFNPSQRYKVNGYKLADGRFFLRSQRVEGMTQEVEREFLSLNLACQSNQLAVVRYFVEERKVVIDGPASKESALFTALNENHPQIVQYLLSKGAQINPEWIRDGEACLQRLPVDHPGRTNFQQSLYLLKGGKIVCGVPMTRLNIGIIIAAIVVCAAAGKYCYNRYCVAQKKNTMDDDEIDAQDGHVAVVRDQG